MNHLVLSDGTEITGIVTKVEKLDREHAPGLATLAAHLRGPILVSKQGKAIGAPMEGDAVVLFGDAALHEAHRPANGLVFTSAALPSVAGGPADPEAWDAAFGAFNAFATGDAEACARAAKAEALSPEMAAHYVALRRMRESGHSDPRALDTLSSVVAAHPEEWLLQEELDALRTPVHA